jgi:tetratricopeptide (TPR) repeat protein
MKKSAALTLLTAMALCGAQICQAEAKKNVNEANKLAREGADAARSQEWDKAVDLLRKATALDKKYSDELSAVYQQQGYAAASEQRYPDAIAAYSEALKLTPQEVRIYEQRAAVEMKANDTDKALADYSEAIKLKPNEVRYLNYRAYIYETKVDLKNSMADTAKVLKIDPKNEEALSRKKRLETREAANQPLPPPPASQRRSPAAGRTP